MRKLPAKKGGRRRKIEIKKIKVITCICPHREAALYTVRACRPDRKDAFLKFGWRKSPAEFVRWVEESTHREEGYASSEARLLGDGWEYTTVSGRTISWKPVPAFGVDRDGDQQGLLLVDFGDEGSTHFASWWLELTYYPNTYSSVIVVFADGRLMTLKEVETEHTMETYNI